MKDPQDLDEPGSFLQSIESAVLAAEDLANLAARPLLVTRPNPGEGAEHFDVIEDRPTVLLRRMRVDLREIRDVVSRSSAAAAVHLTSKSMFGTSSSPRREELSGRHRHRLHPSEWRRGRRPLRRSPRGSIPRGAS